MLELHFIFHLRHIKGMEATAYFLQVVQELQCQHGGVENDRVMQFTDSCVIHNVKDKVAGFTPGGGKELVIRNLGLVNSFGLGAIHISGIIWYFLIIDSGLGGSG